MTTNAKLLPCPFCGAGTTDIIENGRIWTGTEYGDPVSVSIRHWCEPVPGPSRMIERVGTDREQAIRRWNMRHQYVNCGLWRDPKDKPPHLPGEHHSEDVLVVMMDTFECKPAVRIGHVSIGHWRPSGGNGNFDKDILGWMPMPDISQFISSLPHSQEKP